MKTVDIHKRLGEANLPEEKFRRLFGELEDMGIIVVKDNEWKLKDAFLERFRETLTQMAERLSCANISQADIQDIYTKSIIEEICRRKHASIDDLNELVPFLMMVLGYCGFGYKELFRKIHAETGG